ncbi:MAG TPA: alpha/beta hydrolase [Acidimicrobiales bacterium]|jgi:pimeloyl-ACP methyl ester carboxylesterase|nr:alpha/beta hydrolase [Acidimicrobiales bacterium]
MLKNYVVEARHARIEVVEEGEGPVVLMVHGFPESWYSWRHQIPVLAEAGYRAVAIHARGYGRSSAPIEVEAYSMLQHVSDNLGVVEALGVEDCVIIGHDWGSPIAANSALLRPDVFQAVALLSVPYGPPGGRRPTTVFGEFGAAVGEEFYINYFQEPGRAEAEIELDVRSWLRGFYIAASGDGGRAADGGTVATVKPGGMLRERFGDVEQLPGWFTEADLDFYTTLFEHTGFRGALNRYRNMDRDWRDLQPWRNRPITVPSIFIGGEKDGPTMWGARAIERHPETMPLIRGSHILPGCGHWVQQERADQVNELLLDWLKSL